MQAKHLRPSLGEPTSHACLQRSAVMQPVILGQVTASVQSSAPCTTTGGMQSCVMVVCLPTVRAFLATAGDPMVVSSSRYPRLPAATAGRKSCKGVQ